MLNEKNKKGVFCLFKKLGAIFLSTSLVLSGGISYAANSVQPSDSSISIPEEFGKVEESFEGTNDKTIIYIQDAHNSLEAQENIAKIIGHLVEHNDVKTVFEEGYEGVVPTDKYFGFIKDPKVKERTTYFLMDKLRLGGAEYAHINRKNDFKLIGVDDNDLHMENIDLYRKTAARSKETEHDLKMIQKEIQKIANLHFPKELKQWMKLKKRLDLNEIQILDYLKRTKVLLSKSSIQSNEFQKRYPSIDLLTLAEASRDKEVLEKAQKIGSKELFEEINRLEQSFANSYLENQKDRETFEYYRSLELLQRLNRLELSAIEYEVVKGTIVQFNTQAVATFIAKCSGKTIVFSKAWEQHIQSAIRFYEVAHSRDTAIENHLDAFLDDKNEAVAVLIFGGFHKDGIEQILKSRRFSYKIINPKITSLSERHQKYYHHLMSNGHHSFEVPKNLAVAARSESRMQAWDVLGSHLAFSELRVISRAAQENIDRDFVSLDRSVTKKLRLFKQAVSNKAIMRSEVRSKKLVDNSLTRWATNVDVVTPIDESSLPGFQQWVSWNSVASHIILQGQNASGFDWAAYLNDRNEVIFGLPETTQVRAIADGYVAQVSKSYGPYAAFINIEHGESGSGVFSSYHHVVPIVEGGKRVKKGDVIATLYKDPGKQEGKLVHLHFGISNGWNEKNRRLVDPEQTIYSDVVFLHAKPAGFPIFQVAEFEDQPNQVIANFEKIRLPDDLGESAERNFDQILRQAEYDDRVIDVARVLLADPYTNLTDAQRKQLSDVISRSEVRLGAPQKLVSTLVSDTNSPGTVLIGKEQLANLINFDGFVKELASRSELRLVVFKDQEILLQNKRTLERRLDDLRDVLRDVVEVGDVPLEEALGYGHPSRIKVVAGKLSEAVLRQVEADKLKDVLGMDAANERLLFLTPSLASSDGKLNTYVVIQNHHVVDAHPSYFDVIEQNHFQQLVIGRSA